MKLAIEKVFPESKHRNCFFHIKSKCYNKNLRCFAANKGLPEIFEDTVNFSVTEEEFEMLWQKMIDNAEGYLEEGVQNGLLKPSRDPRARAKFLGLTGGGGFFLYIQMHPTPTDLRAVLRDYGEEMMLPALELYTKGLMTDSTMYDAFLEAREKGIPFTSNQGEHNDGGIPTTG